MHRILLATLALSFVTGCKGPPEAPSAFEDLCVYLYSNLGDEDPEVMDAGVNNLSIWLEDHWEETSDGYQIAVLTEETVNDLDENAHAWEGMIGLAVATASAHTVDHANYAMVGMDQSIVYPDTFTEYEREWVSDPECFLDHDCETADAIEYMRTEFPLGLYSISSAYNEYLWSEAETGASMSQRNWQRYPPEVNFSWLEVDDQYYLNVFVPRSKGHFRLQAMWTVYSQDNDVPEDYAMQLAVNFMNDNSETLEGWLDDKYGDPDGD